MKPRPIRELTTYADGETLEVPGRPRVIHTPGHTSGHCALRFVGSGALGPGDELCTLNPLTGARGPQLMPRSFNVSSATCLDSLTKLQDLSAEVVAVGHGEPWHESVAAAVERVRSHRSDVGDEPPSRRVRTSHVHFGKESRWQP